MATSFISILIMTNKDNDNGIDFTNTDAMYEKWKKSIRHMQEFIKQNKIDDSNRMNLLHLADMVNVRVKQLTHLMESTRIVELERHN